MKPLISSIIGSAITATILLTFWPKAIIEDNDWSTIKAISMNNGKPFVIGSQSAAVEIFSIKANGNVTYDLPVNEATSNFWQHVTLGFPNARNAIIAERLKELKEGKK